MSLEKIVSEYKAGKLDKPSYIKSMHEIHKHLFEYSRYIKDKDITENRSDG